MGEPTFEQRPVWSPLTSEMLSPMSPAGGAIQITTLPTEADLAKLAAWTEAHPHVVLRVADLGLTDLEFLSSFPNLRRISLGCHSLESLDGLRHLPIDMEMIDLGASKRRLDLQVLRRFESLRSLHLEKHTKNLDIISRFSQLEELTLRSVSLPDLALLTPLQNLKALRLRLGGTNDLSLLPELTRLRYFEAWRVRGLETLDAVREVPSLRFLFLQALSRLQRLPDLTGNTSLRRVHLDGLKALESVEEVAAAPQLLDVVLADLPKVNPESLACLGNHPTLERALILFGSARKSEQATAIVNRPKSTFWEDWRLI